MIEDNCMRERCLEKAQHAIGMDGRDVWKTHGEKVYVPYRNYYMVTEPEEDWEALVREGLAQRHESPGSIMYDMTPDGLLWMAKLLRISICVVPFLG